MTVVAGGPGERAGRFSRAFLSIQDRGVPVKYLREPCVVGGEHIVVAEHPDVFCDGGVKVVYRNWDAVLRLSGRR